MLSSNAPNRDAEGRPSYPYFDLYWMDSHPDRVPFALWLGETLAGFCLLRDTGTKWQVAEFYIVPACRRKGIGSSAVLALKDYCRGQGQYRWLEARTLLWNSAARDFWRSQGFETLSSDSEALHNVFLLSD